jgi:chromosome segregation ATPase
MTRQNDDMEPIKPDFDELDRPGGVRQRPRQDGQGQASRSPQRRPNAGEGYDDGRRSRQSAALQPRRESSSAGLWLLWLIVLALAGGGGYVLFRQQQVVDGLELELERARSLVNQSQKIAGDLEGQLSQTDATLAQSGNEMARALKKLDAQVRKLEKSSAASQADAEVTVAEVQKALEVVAQKQSSTAVQLGTATKTIGQHTEALKTIGTLSEGLVADQDQLSKRASDLGLRIDSLDKALDDRINSVTEQAVSKSADVLSKRLVAMEGTLDKAQSEAAAADAAVSALRVDTARQQQALERAVNIAEAAGKAAARAGDRPSVSPDTVKTLQRQVDAIDATRQQVVQRLVNADRRLNELTLQLDALAAQ